MMLIDIPDQEVAFYHVAQLGVYVLAVQEASQAQELGVLSGDRLVSINGSQVHTTNDFVQFIQSHTGLPLEMTFTRGPQEEQLFRIFAYNPVSEERVEKR